MVQLNPINVVRMGLLGGLETNTAAISAGFFDANPVEAGRNVASALRHLHILGIGDNETIGQHFAKLEHSNLLHDLIDFYEIRKIPAAEVDPTRYECDHHEELLTLIGTLYRIEPETLEQNIDAIIRYGLKTERDVLDVLHASLQLHTGFRDPRLTLDTKEIRRPLSARVSTLVLCRSLKPFHLIRS